ncbi:MAG: cell surface protein SprA [Syntrophothermus sp.]
MLKIKYTGYEDEIIQSIEAGNVSLQTSPLVGGSEALFGVKAVFKMGPLTLTTLASQKKGEIKEVSVSGGSTTSEFTKRAYDYSTNHYFLDTIYASTDPAFNFFQRYYGNATPDIDPSVQVNYIEVWKSTNTTVRSPNEREANAYITLPPLNAGGKYPANLRENISGGDGLSETGRFLPLQEGTDYTLNPYTGFITLNTQVNENDVIAVAYRTQGNLPGPEDDSFYGEFIESAKDTSQKMVLKLVKPRNLQPNFTIAWRLLLKNIYPIGGRNVKKEGFEFYVKREIEGSEPQTNVGNVKLLQAFGLDVEDASKAPNPDNIFDFRENLTIITETGEIIFPTLEPFGRNLPEGLPDSLAFPQIYSTTPTFARQEKTRDKWELTGKFSGGSSSTYQLGFNVVENSVKVRLNGIELSPGVDYAMDYNVGQLTIRNEAALVPNADLKITYEQNDLFQLASKTLLGARGLIDFTKKTKLGFSILNLNQETLNDKVRIGEEPLSNTIYGLDFQTSADLPFVTKALDNIFSTRELSTFNFAGEYAYMDPDPNTKKSTISSDKEKSIAYIDDFEGSKKIIPIGVSYTVWKDVSIPDRLPYLPDSLTALQRMDFKAKSFWFTQTPANVKVTDIWPQKKVAKADENITVMDYVYIPDTPGTYNYTPRLHENPRENWGGMMKLLSSTASNLVEENIEFIEFWAKPSTFAPDAKVYIDLGRISEDVIPDRQLNTEDDPPYNDAIDPEGKEDKGIDRMTDDEERLKYNSTAADPSGDNFNYSVGSNNYFNINGTQGNAILTDIGRIPDTEDLNKNNQIDLLNSFFRYEIPLDTNAATNKFIAGGGGEESKGWYLYRIPLKEFSQSVADPQFERIEAIRFFVTGTDQPVHLRMTEFNLVGNQWEKVRRDSTISLSRDTVLTVSVINIEDNFPIYQSPSGVQREQDRSKPEENVLKNEQSLNLIIKELQPGDKREAVKYLRVLDVFNYSEMKLFIHGDADTINGNVSVSRLSPQYNSEVYFRFGGDTNNYYEYRQPIRADWNEISIRFNELTAIKQARGDSINQVYRVPVEGELGHFYIVKGNPSLTQVKFLSVGIYNSSGETSTPKNVSGEVWVNELRVIGADDHPGWAYSFNTSLKLADLMTFNFTLSESNPYFHRLADRFGSRISQKNWSVSTDLDIIKLLPFSLPESQLRLTYSHTENVGKPLYLPNTDIRVDQAARLLEERRLIDSVNNLKTPEQLIIESQSINVSDSWSASSIKIKIPSNYWLIRDSFNALSFGFNYNKTFSRSPLVTYNRGWIWNANASYGINLSPDYFFMPANIPVIGPIFALLLDYRNTKVYFTPQMINADMTARRQRNVNVTREQTNTPSQTVISRDFTTTRGFDFNWKITEGGLLNLSSNYKVDINSSLAHLETDIYGQQRLERDVWRDIFQGVFFGKDNMMTQSFDLKTSPRLPSLWDINKYFNLTAGYNTQYRWDNDFRQGDRGRSAGFSSKLTASLTLRLKALTQPLFEEKKDLQNNTVINNNNNNNTRRGRDNQNQFNPNVMRDSTNKLITDSLSVRDSLANDSLAIDSLNQVPKTSSLTTALLFLKSVAHVVFFDYESISINFQNDNSLSKSGLFGKGTGLKNFWGIDFNDDRGPSRGFMLGISNDVGRRAINSNLSDVYSQRNQLDLKTSKPLWEGARIDLNWKVNWTVNRNTTLRSDSLGNVAITNISSTGTTSRSFFSLPPTLFLSTFKSGIKRVSELYNPDDNNLSEAFIEGFETLPILSKLGFLKDVAKYIPRPNWRVSWDGLEKFFLFSSFTKKVTLEHQYISDYTEGWKITPEGTQTTQSQKVSYGFTPLIGLTFNFGQVWGGNLTSNVKYSARTDYSLGVSTTKISEVFSKEIGITANYAKQGFEIPLFGLALKNDIEFSFSYSSSRNSEVLYDMDAFNEAGIPQNGTIRTQFEPSIRYTISSKVTVRIFYRRLSVEPEGASRIPPSTQNEAGLDVHISIN